MSLSKISSWIKQIVSSRGRSTRSHAWNQRTNKSTSIALGHHRDKILKIAYIVLTEDFTFSYEPLPVSVTIEQKSFITTTSNGDLITDIDLMETDLSSFSPFEYKGFLTSYDVSILKNTYVITLLNDDDIDINIKDLRRAFVILNTQALQAYNRRCAIHAVQNAHILSISADLYLSAILLEENSHVILDFIAPSKGSSPEVVDTRVMFISRGCIYILPIQDYEIVMDYDKSRHNLPQPNVL